MIAHYCIIHPTRILDPVHVQIFQGNTDACGRAGVDRPDSTCTRVAVTNLAWQVLGEVAVREVFEMAHLACVVIDNVGLTGLELKKERKKERNTETPPINIRIT